MKLNKEIFSRRVSKYMLPVFVFLSGSSVTRAQEKKVNDHDSSFYTSYREQLTGRLYLSRKYTTLTLSPPGDIPAIKYRPNTTLNIGVGGTYKSVTVNIGVGLNSFNPNQEKGKTHYLDLQSHFYARKWNFDLLAEFYKGYYLAPKGRASADGRQYYVRRDIAVQFGGIAAYQALNAKNFSYQAGLVQNEWQKKSAGSILVGGEIYYGAIHGDSTLAPAILDPGYATNDLDKLHFFEFGPGIGYGYTLVIRQHYFVLGSATMNIDFRYAREKDLSGDHDKFDATPNFIFHAGAGYNTAVWNLSILWVNDQIHIKGGSSGYRYTVTTGNYRLIYAKRFSLTHKGKKIVKPIDNILDQN